MLRTELRAAPTPPIRIPSGRGRAAASGAAILSLVLLFILVPAPLPAQTLADYDYEDLEFRGIGLEAGRVWPSHVDATKYFGLRVDLGFVGPRVRIAPMARYWSSSLLTSEVDRLADQIVLVCERQGDVSCPEELELGEIRLSDLELAADAHFIFAPDRPVSPYLGAGVALHLLNGRGESIDGTFVEDLLDTVAPGLGAVGGLTMQIASSVQLGAEARFMLASDVMYGGASIHGVWTLPTPGTASLVSFRGGWQ